MGKTIRKGNNGREVGKARNWDVVGMIVANKATRMRDRRNRRSKDAKHSWQNEDT